MIGVRPPLYDRALIAHRYNIISVFRDEHTPQLLYIYSPPPPNHSPIIYTLNHPITDIDKVSKGKEEEEEKKTDILEK
jgi:hypothetical protein